MDEKEVVDVIQFYRHEILNHLQIIQGYITLGNVEKAKDNMNKLFDYFHKERNLLNLNIPHVFLWIFECNRMNQQFKLSYSTHFNNKKLTSNDLYIKEKLDHIMQDIKRLSNNEKIYFINIAFRENGDTCTIEVTVDIDDAHLQTKAAHSFEGIKVTQSSNNRIYSFNVLFS